MRVPFGLRLIGRAEDGERPMDTEDTMAASVRGRVGKSLPYAELVAP